MNNERIPGVSVEVKLGLGIEDCPSVKINGDCYCGECFSRLATGNDSAILFVKVAYPQSKNIYCFTVDDKKNVNLKNGTERGFGKLFHAKIPLVKNKKRVCHTKHPNNKMLLLRLISGGKIEIWEIALISQDGNFFVTTQKIYKAKFYWDRARRKVVCPRFEKKWPQVVETAKNLLNRNERLCPAEKYELDSKEENGFHARLVPKTGRVIWYNLAQGYGAIQTSENIEARVHWKEITRYHILAFLNPGEIVKYETLCIPYGETTFQKEAIGVMPIE